MFEDVAGNSIDAQEPGDVGEKAGRFSVGDNRLGEFIGHGGETGENLRARCVNVDGAGLLIVGDREVIGDVHEQIFSDEFGA